MTTLEQDLDRLRERLRLAIAADLRRRSRRRRRVVQLALVPGLALTAGGVAFAVVPVLNQPAPPSVQQSVDELRKLDPAHAPDLPEGRELSLWARDGDLLLYGTVSSSSGNSCTFAYRGETTVAGARCSSDRRRPGPDEIRFDSIGGATEREANFARGQVGAPGAKTIEISAAGVPEVTEVPVGHDGWFVAQLPDSTLGSLDPSARPPMLSAVARDASGTVVARTTTP
jgi:hypothetical protein